jgi:chorismate synthase
VLAGAVAKQLLAKKGIFCRGGLVQLGSVRARARDWGFVEQNELRATDPEVVQSMTELLDSARKERDSLGGVVEVVAFGVMPGLGEPVFGKLDAALGAAMFSIPAVKGVEFGLGFELSSKRGSEANDEMTPEGFLSNNHGGILAGISSGAPIVIRLAIKPTSSIPREQQTVTTEFSKTTVSTLGRHDPCVAIRAVPVAEAMLAITLIDFVLQDAAAREMRKDFSPLEPLRYGLSETLK